jgi:hydroxymethylglutaryl-CoA reductase
VIQHCMMKQNSLVSGFSRLDKEQKIKLVAAQVASPEAFSNAMQVSWMNDRVQQKLIDEFSENTLANFVLPYGVAPNFLVNGNMYIVPMVIEESSVVAAAAGAAKFWAERGGFHSEVVDIEKIGQVHFTWNGGFETLNRIFPEIRELMITNSSAHTSKMKERGGGIRDIRLIDMTNKIPDYYQLMATFDTRDSMGANFINSCLEEFADTFRTFVSGHEVLSGFNLQVIMSILSNYTPNCIVRTWLEGGIEENGHQYDGILTDREFINRFATAVLIAHVDKYRATTHNKGIYNGIDAVVLATGNDFRAVEACGHAYASRNGDYSSLSEIEIKGNTFRFSVNVPLALGTVGGLTRLHPLAKQSMELLGSPDASLLMQIASAAGLANNYSAIKSLITKGIQKGHMKMHLMNILNVLSATEIEKTKATDYFMNRKVTHSAVSNFLEELRSC